MPGSASKSGRRITGRRALPILALIFLGLGSAGLAAGAAAYAMESRGPRSAVADATILAAGYHPLVEFKAADGAVIQFTSPVRSSFWKAGDKVAVAYDPADPSDAAVDGLVGRWLFACLFAALGGAFAAIGLGLGLLSALLRPTGS